MYKNTSVHNEKRYYVGRLWVKDNNKLSNKYSSALVQLKFLEKGLKKEQILVENFLNTINEESIMGYLVSVKDSRKVESCSEPEWYLSHHPVFKPNTPVKAPSILNEGAKFHGASLNKSLLTGPDLQQNQNFYSYSSYNIHFLYQPTLKECSCKFECSRTINHFFAFCGVRILP